MVRIVIIIAVVIGTVLLFRRLFGGELFKIVVRGGGVEIKGKVPGYGDSDVRQFIQELRLPQGATIKGVPGGERYKLKFNGLVPESHQQRIRNFFYLKF